jgi:hypothetical protein
VEAARISGGLKLDTITKFYRAGGPKASGAFLFLQAQMAS